MYSTQMTGVFSGGLAYEFTQEPNDYGLVTINGTTAHLLNDFVALQGQFAKVTSVTAGTAQAVTRPTTCPAANSYAHLNGTNVLPDTPAADLIKNGIPSNLYSPGKLIRPRHGAPITPSSIRMERLSPTRQLIRLGTF